MDLLRTRGGRRWVFGALYLSEGAPIGLIWWALPTMLRAAGADVDAIAGTLAVLVLPWTLKFLWAPLVDRLRGRRWGRRGWVLAAQGVMALTLLPLAWLDPVRDLQAIRWLLIAHAFAAATQDVAIDAWAIAVTPEHERGRLTGSMQTGMWIGRWLFGAGLLLVIDRAPIAWVVAGLMGTLGATSMLAILSRDTSTPRGARDSDAGPGVAEALANALRRRETWLALALALIAGAGFESVGGIAGPFLIDHGFSRGAVGAFQTMTIPAVLLGLWVGGLAGDRLGHGRVFGIATVVLAVLILTLACGEAAAAPGAFFLAMLVAIYGAIGLFIASSYALFMDLTDPRIGATQFSAYMGATNACEAWSVYAVGQLSHALGYAPALAAMAVISLTALPALHALRRRLPNPPAAV